MSGLIDQLAELTGHRDRDIMDVTLVGAIREMILPRALAIYRSIGEPGNERWLTRTRLGPGDSLPAADPVWSVIEALPRLADHPARFEAFSRRWDMNASELTLSRVGSEHVIHVDVRVLAATNKELSKEVERGMFREDLFFRLAVFPLRSPALRERVEDIPLLADAFMAGFSRENGTKHKPIDDEVVRALASRKWPGTLEVDQCRKAGIHSRAWDCSLAPKFGKATTG